MSEILLSRWFLRRIVWHIMSWRFKWFTRARGVVIILERKPKDNYHYDFLRFSVFTPSMALFKSALIQLPELMLYRSMCDSNAHRNIIFKGRREAHFSVRFWTGNLIFLKGNICHHIDFFWKVTSVNWFFHAIDT